jgi:hypothetical protein
MGLVLRRQHEALLDLRRVLRRRNVQWVLVRDDRVVGRPGLPYPDRTMILGAACALAFLAALPQLCSP